jgi:hypothetical protein
LRHRQREGVGARNIQLSIGDTVHWAVMPLILGFRVSSLYDICRTEQRGSAANVLRHLPQDCVLATGRELPGPVLIWRLRLGSARLLVSAGERDRGAAAEQVQGARRHTRVLPRHTPKVRGESWE